MREGSDGRGRTEGFFSEELTVQLFSTLAESCCVFRPCPLMPRQVSGVGWDLNLGIKHLFSE